MTNLDFLQKEKLHTGFGSEIIQATSYNDILVQSGLNWNVDVHPTFTMVGDKLIEVPGKNVVVRTEDEKPLGVVSSHYKIVNNADAFAFTESLYDGKDLEFIRGGSFNGGSSTWLEAKISGQFSVLGDEVDCYLIFKNTHDGSGSVTCMIVPERIACSNALNLPMERISRIWRCTHSGDPMKKIDEAKKILLAGSSYMEALTKEAEELEKIKLTDNQITQFINRSFPIREDMTERTKNNCIDRRLQLREVYEAKDDLQNYGQSGFRFISAVADYADHFNGRNTEKSSLNRFMSVAQGHPLVDKAYEMVMAA